MTCGNSVLWTGFDGVLQLFVKAVKNCPIRVVKIKNNKLVNRVGLGVLERRRNRSDAVDVCVNISVGFAVRDANRFVKLTKGADTTPGDEGTEG